MKLLTVIPSYWPAFIRGGPVASVHYLNKALIKKGIDVTVYTTNVDLGKEIPVNHEVNMDGVKIIYFAFTNLFEFATPGGWQFSWHLTQALKRNLNSFDLIYIASIWSYPTTATAYYARQYRKPYVLAPRGMLYPEVFFKKIWKKWPYYQLVIKRDLKGASAIHYTTQDEAKKTQSFLGLHNREVVLPNGIELPVFSHPVDREELMACYPHLKNKKVILFLGRINWKKGLDILVKAYALLREDIKDVHLLIVGQSENGYSEKVKGWIKKEGMNYADFGLKKDNHRAGDAQVTFTGMLTGEEKIKAYAGSDVFVLPSYSENFGMAVVEAMACGLPVVISNKVGIYNEIARNKAGIVSDTNTKSFYQGIKLLLENPDLRKELAINGRKLVEEDYNIDNVADKMIEAYQKILT